MPSNPTDELNRQAPNLTIGHDEIWCIFGTNQSGIAAFFDRIVCRKQDLWAQSIGTPEQIGVVSFKDQQQIYETELARDQTDLIDRIDPGTPARHFLENVDSHKELIHAFNLTGHLDHGYRQLSTGQSRKLLILSRITHGCHSILLQCPYDGLDKTGRTELDRALEVLSGNGTRLVLFVSNFSDIPSWVTHVGMISQNRITLKGERQEVLPLLKSASQEGRADLQATKEDLKGGATNLSEPITDKRNELVQLKDGTAGYGGKRVFEDLSLKIRTGEHTLVTGPNGCGKSTLLQMICGDHHACYTNDLRIFGMQRGQGESIWDIKKRMGIVSSELHRNWIVPGSVKECVLSGFFDSIGIYRTYSHLQEQQALHWLSKINLLHKKDDAFRAVSFSDQRLTLIARSLIKVPELLILDEPTQGLDELNRKALLDFLEGMALENICTILYVSHREDEYRDFFVQHLDMG